MSDYDPNAPKEGLEPSIRATIGAVRELLVAVSDLSSDQAVKDKLRWHLDQINSNIEKTMGGGWGTPGPRN